MLRKVICTFAIFSLGLGTLLAEEFMASIRKVEDGKISLVRMIELFTTGPAGVIGRERKIAEGQPADLTIFSADHAWTFRAEDSASKSRNTPFDGRAFKGAPMFTIVAGRVAYRRNA